MSLNVMLQGLGFIVCFVGLFYLSAWAAGEWMRQYWKHRGPSNINVNWNPIVQMKSAPVSDSDEGKEK